MSRRLIRTVCMEVLANLELPDPFDIDVFCSRLAELRGRDLHVHYVSGLARLDEMCGLYYGAADDDHLYVEADTLAKHRLAILLHEIGHMLLGHLPDPELSQSLDPDRVLALLARGGRQRKTRERRMQEQEADDFALLMLRWLDRGGGEDRETRAGRRTRRRCTPAACELGDGRQRRRREWVTLSASYQSPCAGAWLSTASPVRCAPGTALPVGTCGWLF